MNGEQLDAEIYIGPTYYMRLKHMVKDKINHRARGPKTSLTRQTVGGRANDGGLRIGEMERDGVIAHGAAGFLQESMLNRGDEYFMAVCNNTGSIAIYNNSQNLFLSPMSDGPIKFHTTIDKKLNIENISKYGRNFSILRIPYAFKLLIQELQVMNIQMRLITEDNIDQLTSLGFSNNIVKLTKNEDTDIKLEIGKINKANKDNAWKHTSLETPDNVNEPIEFPKEETVVLEPEALAWSYYSYDEDRGEAYKSIILNTKGVATEVWFVGENDGQLPNRYPAGWKTKAMIYMIDKTPIPPNVMIESLNINQVPNNWSIAMDKVQREREVSPAYDPNSPVYAPGSPAYNPNSPAYDPNTPPYDPNSPPYAPDSPAYGPNETPPYAPGSPLYGPNETPPYAPGSPLYAPTTPPGTPSGSPPPLPNHYTGGGKIVVLDSDKPVVIMPNNNSIETTNNQVINPEIEIDTTLDNKELDNITELLKKTKPKRDDGIELIINENLNEKEEEKKDEENDSSEKKTIKF